MLTNVKPASKFSLRLPPPEIKVEKWQWIPAILLGVIVGVLPMKWAIASLIGFAGIFLLLAIIEYPLVGLVAMLILGPFGGLEETLIALPTTSGQLILFFTIAVWLGRGLKKGKIYFPRTILTPAITIFIIYAAFSLWFATSIMPGVTEILKWIEILVIIWITLDLTREYKREHVVQATVVVLLATSLVQALIGVWQFALARSGPWHFAIAGGFYRASGTIQQPNPYAGYITLNLFLAMGAFVGILGPRLPKKWWYWQAWREFLLASPLLRMIFFTVGLLGIALLGSWSRGGWINFAAGLIVLVVFLPTRLRYGLLAVLGSGLIFLVVLQIGILPPAVSERLLGFTDSFSGAVTGSLALTPENHAILERLAHWAAAVNMARDRLWTGVGFGNYEIVYYKYALPGWPEALGHAHNYYLNVLAEMGIFGLLVYIGMWLAIFWATARCIKRHSWFERSIAVSLLAAWTGFSVHHFFDNLYVQNIYLHMGGLFALVVMMNMMPTTPFAIEQDNRKKSIPLAEIFDKLQQVVLQSWSLLISIIIRRA